MIRILTNYNCNLCCSYCFEKHLWNKKEKLTPDELKTILEFAGPDEEVSLVGGEPTIHPQFSELMAVLRSYPNPAYLLTNGLFHSNYLDEIMDTFKIVMVNLNDPRNYTAENWAIVQNNIEKLAVEDSPCWIQLGINIFDKDQRFEYLIPFMKFYRIIKEIRISFAKPNYCFSNASLSDLPQMKETALTLLNLVALAATLGFSCSLDCPISPCLFDTDQLQFLSQYVSNLRFGDCAGGFTFFPGLQIGHCFGSFSNMYPLTAFNSLIQIEEDISRKEDPLMYDVASFEVCKKCLFKRNRTCQGGCLSFKVQKLLQAAAAKKAERAK